MLIQIDVLSFSASYVVISVTNNSREQAAASVNL
jgi:hypothetical protein